MKIINLKPVLKRNFNLFMAFIAISLMVSCSSSSDDDMGPGVPPTGGTGSTGNGGNNGGSGGNTGSAVNAPGFSLKSLSGSDVKLSDFNDKVVVLFFFGYDCPTCKAVAPQVQSELTTPYASNSDYQILGLDQWNGSTNAVQGFKSTTGVSFPLLLDASAVASDYETTYDRLVIINKAGEIVFSGKQVVSSDISAAKQKVDELLGN